MPVSFLFSSGITTPTALAAPVLDGMMFSRMPRPPRQSLFDGPSTVFCVAVAACTVVIRPRLMPQVSFSTLATGARQLVVHEAFEMMGMDKKVLQGRIRLVLLRKLGAGMVTGDYPADALQATLRNHFEAAA